MSAYLRGFNMQSLFEERAWPSWRQAGQVTTLGGILHSMAAEGELIRALVRVELMEVLVDGVLLINNVYLRELCVMCEV